MRKILTILISVSMLLVTSACGDDKAYTNTTTGNNQNTQTEQQTNNENETQSTENSELYADAIGITIELENGGIMKGELYPNLAPKTVDNFVKLVKDNFYDGLIFHRVIEGFMIQGGGYDADMTPKEAETIVGEFTQNGFENNLKHTKGVLSMARTPDPNSASSQFFIMHADAPHLDGAYAAFGRITEGLEFVDEIATAKTGTNSYGMSDVPVEPIIIKTIKID